MSRAMDEIVKSMDESVKTLYKRQEHMYYTVGLIRERLGFKAHHLKEDAWIVEYEESYYFLAQDDTKYTITKINCDEVFEIIYYQEWMGEPFEIAQEIATHFGIDAAITGN